MHEAIKISIIIPVYNLQEELPRCVGSVIAQTYTNLEIIVVDDGSKDDSRTIIQKLASKDNRIITVFKENGGVTSARLEGIRRASGEYIGFVDGDDEIEPDMYEILLKNAIRYEADISHCGYQMIFVDGRVHKFYDTKCLKKQNKETGIQDLLEGTLVEPGLCNKLFKRQLFEVILSTNLIESGIKINEDLLMNYYLFSEAQSSVFYDVCKYHYIVRNTSASRQKMNHNKIYDPIRVKRIILEYCSDDLKTVAQKALLNTCIYVYCSLVLEKESQFKEEKKKVRKEILKNHRYYRKLSKRTKLLCIGIVKFPFLFNLLYPVYSKSFQRKKYD